MQLAVQDIRRLGYLKIMSYFYDDYDFDDCLANVDKEIYDNDNKIYSVPKKWFKIDVNALKENYNGFTCFANFCEPMLGLLNVTECIQRKFRNVWTTIWDFFGKDCGKTPSEVKWLKELGVRLVYLCGCNIELSEAELKVVSFYDTVIKWGIFTRQELCTEYDMSQQMDVLEKLVVLPAEEFVVYVKEIMR